MFAEYRLILHKVGKFDLIIHSFRYFKFFHPAKLVSRDLKFLLSALLSHRLLITRRCSDEMGSRIRFICGFFVITCFYGFLEKGLEEGGRRVEQTFLFLRGLFGGRLHFINIIEFTS